MSRRLTLIIASAALMAACSSSLPTTGGAAPHREPDLAASALSSGACDETGEVTMPVPMRAENLRMEASAAPTR